MWAIALPLYPEVGACDLLARVTAPTLQRWVEDLFLDAFEAFNLYLYNTTTWAAQLQTQVGRVACDFAAELHSVEVFHFLFGEMESRSIRLPKHPQDGTQKSHDRASLAP